MAVYADIPNAEVDIDTPAKSSTAKKFRDNPLAIMEGDPTALAAGKGVHIEKAGQTAIITDDVDVDKVLTPDGLGGAQWSSGVSGLVFVGRTEILANSNVINIPGIDPTKSAQYLLNFNLVINAASQIAILENGVSAGATGTHHAPGGFTGASVEVILNTIGRIFPSFGFAAFDKLLSGTMLIHAREVTQGITHYRRYEGRYAANNSMVLNAPMDADQIGSFWCSQRLAGVLASIGFSAAANGFRVGSSLTLYRYAL